MNFRRRVALVLMTVAIVATLLMAILGRMSTIGLVKHLGREGSMDMAAMIAARVTAVGVSSDQIDSDPQLLEQVEALLQQSIEPRGPDAPDRWTTASILVREGDGWRILAGVGRAPESRKAHVRGDTLPIAHETATADELLDQPVAGNFSTDLNSWFGGTAPLWKGRAIVTVALHEDELGQHLRDVALAAMPALLAAATLAIVLGWWGAGLILRPIDEVRAFAARLGRRDYAVRVREHGPPEMRAMQADLNRLGSYLAERDAARVDALASLAELRDHRETAAHVKRVSGVSVELLQGWQARHPIPPDEARIQQEILRLAAVTHDLGKVGVPDEILKKPGKLDPAEYAVMKRHTVLGAARIHGHDPYDAAAREVALRHHERWDGKGYPGEVDLASLEGDLERQMNLAIAGPGLAGQAIPLFGRIVALADVYDALRSPRVYKEAWSEERVLHTIREEAGKAFDPELVDIFMERHDRIRAAWAAHPDAPHPQVTSPASAA